MTELEAVARRFRGDGRWLNVGCGRDRKAGYVNVDLSAAAAPDAAADVLHLPFRAGTFSYVECRDVLEHVDVVAAMRELHRVITPGGHLAIQSVHFTSRDFHVDPTHVRAYSNRTFEFFTAEGLGAHRGYYFDFAFRRVRFNAIQFHHGALVWNRMVEGLVNRSERSRDAYELTMWSRLFPAANVITVLER